MSATENEDLLEKWKHLPDFDTTFINEDDIAAFERAINAPDVSEEKTFTAYNDWRPVKQRVKRRSTKRRPRRGKDETREGFVYQILKWPLLAVVFTWLSALSIIYVITRVYISQYEYWVTWRGKRQRLRRKLREAKSYEEWKTAAKELDAYLGIDAWKEDDAFAYYDYVTIRKLVKGLSRAREQAESGEKPENVGADGNQRQNKAQAVEDLSRLVQMSVTHPVDNPRLYSQSYYGTKNLVQNFVEEVERCLKFLCTTDAMPAEDKRIMFKQLSSNYGKSALCLSGGASFAYYHFGVVKAHLEAGLLPNIITGTSGGALVAALTCTRTDEELKALLVPALAAKITACHDDTWTWIRRWWRTGARFDSVDWARRLCWFTRGSMTFREAYERTGRILNVSCIPADPHSPSMLLNYITAPDCCIFSAVLASAAVPGIQNPVCLMTKTKGSSAIAPYSFGNKWKDGSLRTDIPLRALNLHFNVNFSIVSQVNPHVNIFFFSSRGSVGRPVTHRKGRGWRGGFLGSALEQYLKLDMAKWLKVLRHLELLPRPLSQDWSSVFLQKFDGTITIWPKTVPSDFYYILTDPTYDRLERMLEVGQRCTYPKLKFVSNRLRIERMIEHGRNLTRSRVSDLEEVLSSEDIQHLQAKKKKPTPSLSVKAPANAQKRANASSPSGRLAKWFNWQEPKKDSGLLGVNGNVPRRASWPVAKEGEPLLPESEDDEHDHLVDQSGLAEDHLDWSIGEEEEEDSSEDGRSDGSAHANGVDLLPTEPAGDGGAVVQDGESVEKFEAKGFVGGT